MIDKLKMDKLIVFMLLVFMAKAGAYAQLKRSEVLGAYVYNFAKLSYSDKQNRLNTYNIVVVTGEKALQSEFKKLAKELLVREKKIDLTISSGTDKIDMEKTCLIFVGSDKIEHYPGLFNDSSEDEILLVSENYDNKRDIMLNLYETEEGKMLFEINKGNIYSRKIKINDEILLMGGTEVELVEMYLESREELVELEKELAKSQGKLSGLEKQVKTTERKLEEQKLEVEKQKLERQNLNSEIDNYKTQLELQEQAYRTSEKKLHTFNDSLRKSKKKLEGFRNEIVERSEFLEYQKQEIEKKEIILAEKNVTIRRQRITVTLFVIGSTIISLLSILLLKNIRDKKKKNLLLNKQQKEICLKNNELAENNKEIQSMNNELNEKNEELTTTLEEIKQIQKQLVQSEKMASLGVLSAGIAHEINNPINFVYAGINSLLRDFKDIEPVIEEVSKIKPGADDIEEKLENIQRIKQENYFDDAIEAIPEIINDIKIGADRTAEIVKGLRSFSRVDKGERLAMNIHDGLDTSLLLLKNKYKNHIEVVRDYESTMPPVSCYPGKINQAFLNVISNAIDSIQEKGTIWISTRKEKNNIFISIKDNGCGIPEKIREKLYDPFFTTKPVGKGTGLGLSITYGIIGEHNGKIELKSEVNRGSEFIITLPFLGEHGS